MCAATLAWLDDAFGHRPDEVEAAARGFGLEAGLDEGGAVLEAEAATDALGEVGLGGRVGAGEGAGFGRHSLSYEAAGGEDAVGVELLLDAAHEFEGFWGDFAEDVDLAFEFGRAVNHHRAAEASHNVLHPVYALRVGPGAKPGKTDFAGKRRSFNKGSMNFAVDRINQAGH